MPDTAIHTAAWLINPDVPPVAGGAILVRDGMVAATGTLAELKSRYPAPVTDHHDCAILPGFVNAHTHLGDTIRLVARLGGYLGRNNDPPPGHQLMWKGYKVLEIMCEAISLIRNLDSS